MQVGNSFADVARHFSPFDAEPFNLHEALATFTWPTVVISGDRDIRTPRFIAEDITDRAPNATLLMVRNHGHSALDTQQKLALTVMRAMAENIDGEGDFDTSSLPNDPVGRPGLITKLLSLRLFLARVLPAHMS